MLDTFSSTVQKTNGTEENENGRRKNESNGNADDKASLLEDDYLNETTSITQGDRLNAIKAVRRINQLHNPHHHINNPTMSTSVPAAQNRSAYHHRSSLDLTNSHSINASASVNNLTNTTSNYRYHMKKYF